MVVDIILLLTSYNAVMLIFDFTYCDKTKQTSRKTTNQFTNYVQVGPARCIYIFLLRISKFNGPLSRFSMRYAIQMSHGHLLQRYSGHCLYETDTIDE